MVEKFSKRTIEHLKYYVYGLRDPGTDKSFTLAREKETVLSVVHYNKDNCSSFLLMIGGAVVT
jgi:hypothetical protein